MVLRPCRTCLPAGLGITAFLDARMLSCLHILLQGMPHPASCDTKVQWVGWARPFTKQPWTCLKTRVCGPMMLLLAAGPCSCFRVLDYLPCNFSTCHFRGYAYFLSRIGFASASQSLVAFSQNSLFFASCLSRSLITSTLSTLYP